MDNASKYSPIVDLLITWARLTIRANGSEEIIDQLRQEIEQFRSNTEATGMLGDGICRLKTAIGQAMTRLVSEDTLYLTAEDVGYAPFLPEEYNLGEERGEPGIMVLLSLQTLDDAVYLNLALDLYSGDLPESLVTHRARINELVAELTTENQPPCHRLVPLNILRRQALENLAVDMRALFPWYNRFSELDPGSLSLLAEIMSGRTLANIEPERKGDLLLLFDSIVDDDALYERLKSEAVLWQQLPQAFEEAWAWRLLAEATAYARQNFMPAKIVEASAVNAAIRENAKAILNQVPHLEWRLQAAFCGIGLSDEERLSGLEPVEQAILDGTMENLGPNTEAVQQWLCNPEDFHLAQRLYADYLIKLEGAVDRGFAPIPYAIARKLHHHMLMTDSLHLAPLAKAILMLDAGIFAPDRFLAFAARIVENVAALFWRLLPPVPAGGEQYQQQQAVDLDILPFLPPGPLPLPAHQKDIYDEDKLFVYLLAEEAMRPLLGKLRGFCVYWRVEAILADGRTVPSDCRYGELPLKISAQDVGGDFATCQAVMLAISDNHDDLARAFEEPVPPEEEVDRLNVFLIIYIKQAQGEP